MIVCGQCQGRCRLLRFLRLVQTVNTQKRKALLPSGALGTPKGPPSGHISVEKPLGFVSDDAAKMHLAQSSPGLTRDRIQEVAATVANPQVGDDANQIGWLSLEGEWFDGWELHCTTGGSAKSYFVPDTAASVVGPRLYSKTKFASVVGAVAAIITVILATMHFAAEHERRLQETARAAEVARQVAEHEAHLVALRSDLARAIQEIDTALASVTSLSDDQASKSLEARLDVLKQGLGRFDELQPAPKEIADRTFKLQSAITTLNELDDTIDALDVAVRSTKEGDELAAKRAWVEADDSYANAIMKWSTHPELMRALKLPNANGELAAVDPAAQLVSVEAKRKRISGPVAVGRARLAAEEKRREQQEEAERKRKEQRDLEEATFAYTCGEKPQCGPSGCFFGSEPLVMMLKRTANDPSSIDVTDCTAARLTREHCWVTSCDVRGKNGFGATVLNHGTFWMNMQGWHSL